jgi:SAM-dependent methyltransferase
MENPLKALFGDSAEQYVDLKLRWLLRQYPALLAGSTARILDYGCGAATLLRLMVQAGVQAALVGCDISSVMLEEAEHRWPKHLGGTKPELLLQQGPVTPFPEGHFDLVVASAVLHHVQPAKRSQVYSELCRVTRAGGQVVIFEHNPLNPLTRHVVAHTQIDRNAILLPAQEVRVGLTSAGATGIRTCYMMFIPPRIPTPFFLEAMLGWLPLGAQYAVTATVSSTPLVSHA